MKEIEPIELPAELPIELPTAKEWDRVFGEILESLNARAQAQRPGSAPRATAPAAELSAQAQRPGGSSA